MKRNPLSIAFGHALKELREEGSVSVSEVSESIGINDSYYRVVESGSTTVHISKAVDFYHGLTSNGIEIRYEGIRDVLLGISYVNNYFIKVENGYEVNQAYKNGILEQLKVLEPKLHLLLDKLEKTSVFDSLDESNQEIVSLFSKKRFTLFILEFLTNYEDIGESIEKIGDSYGLNFFSDIPTYYFEFLNSVKLQLLDMPISIDLQEVAKWEERNGLKFKRLDIIVQDHDHVSSLKNLENYTYDYLYFDSFEQMNVIYLNPDIEESKVEESFYTNLEKARIKKYGVSSQGLMRKVKFFSVPKDLLKGAESRLSLAGTWYNGTWIFTFHNDIRIGFIATIYDNGMKFEYSQGLSLNYKETIGRLSFMEKVMTWGEG